MRFEIEAMYTALKQRLSSEGICGLCVDVDDTLSATNLHWAEHHLRVYGAPSGIHARNIIGRYRYVKDVPWWRENTNATTWVDAQMDSTEAKLDLPIVEGALEGILALQAILPIVTYLTGRSQCTNDGTRRWLRETGFPEIPVLAFPSETSAAAMELTDRNVWKSGVLEYLFPNVIGIVDDNADLVHTLSPSYSGTIYLFSHEMGPRTPLDVVCCPNWDDVVREVRKKSASRSGSFVVKSES